MTNNRCVKTVNYPEKNHTFSQQKGIKKPFIGIKTYVMNTHTTRLNYYIIVVLLNLFFIAGCKKDKPLEEINAGISFKVNGTLKTVAGEQSVFGMLNPNTNTLTVTANLTSTNESIILVIPGIRGKGEFPITGSAQATYTNGSVVASNTYNATTGFIKITTFQSGGVKGTFEFYSENSAKFYKNITEGTFEAVVQKQ